MFIDENLGEFVGKEIKQLKGVSNRTSIKVSLTDPQLESIKPSGSASVNQSDQKIEVRVVTDSVNITNLQKMVQKCGS